MADVQKYFLQLKSNTEGEEGMANSFDLNMEENKRLNCQNVTNITYPFREEERRTSSFRKRHEPSWWVSLIRQSLAYTGPDIKWSWQLLWRIERMESSKYLEEFLKISDVACFGDLNLLLNFASSVHLFS